MPISKIMPTTHPDAITAAVSIIQQNGTVVFPTDTIYGVAAHAFSPQGIRRLYQVKQRPGDKALPVLIGELKQLEALLLVVDDRLRQIASAFWPGALTLVALKGPNIPADLSPYPTIGVRMPDLAFTLSLLKAAGPLATTSANLSGGLNPTTVQDVLDQLDGRVDLILDGGATPGPAASTVVDVSGFELKVLREGPISLDQIKARLSKEA